MGALTWRSAGESHGTGMVVIMEGVPKGLPLDLALIDSALKLRQGGLGRGGRQKLEADAVEVLGGVRAGITIGSPLALFVANRDRSLERLPEPTRPRPGHADLAGCFRHGDHDIRGVLERASARETVARVAAGGVAGQILAALGIAAVGHVVALGGIRARRQPALRTAEELAFARGLRDRSRLYTLDPGVEARMADRIAEAGRSGDTLGGVVEVVAAGVPPGIGSHLQHDQRLDARLGAAILSIPALKGVEIGEAVANAARPGSRVHDEILPAGGTSGPSFGGTVRASNRAGGIEGGITNGQPVVVRGHMKPLSTLRRPLRSVDLRAKVAVAAGYERSDVCAVPAAAVVAEAMVLLVLADAVVAKFGGETLAGLQAAWERHLETCRRL
jgi:chorismate synthase